jgi:acyl-CoA synthetase (NDP forming)
VNVAGLDRLFDPRAVAVVGASPRPGSIGGLVLRRLLRSGRPVFPVHPSREEICGIKAVADPSQLPDGVDLAVIAVAAERAVLSAEACARRGIPYVVVLAGGFAETGDAGRLLEARLAALSRSYSLRILGPNTLGLWLPRERLDTLFVEHAHEALAGGGGVALVTQSGSVGVESLSLAGNIGFGLRAFVGLGNKCDLDELDFLRHFAADPLTSCVALYLEDVARARPFLEQALETSRLKPVVAVKAGRTAAGAAAVTSHTGRLAGSDRVVDGAFRQFGIQRAFDDEELCDAARALSLLPAPEGGRVAVMTPAGGYGVLAADHVESGRSRAKLEMARLSESTVTRLRRVLPAFAAVGNPVDLTAVADDGMIAATLDVLLEDDGVDIVLCAAFFAPPGVSDRLIGIVSERAGLAQKPIIPFTIYGSQTDEYLRRFHDAGVVGFPSVARAVRSARFVVERAKLLAALEPE